ncbi:hypothetical protein GCM10010207_22130 [Streptomyces atratus]|nr:hypothetical protein GCM10010207_22130 [Streptomyces atratus]
MVHVVPEVPRPGEGQAARCGPTRVARGREDADAQAVAQALRRHRVTGVGVQHADEVRRGGDRLAVAGGEQMLVPETGFQDPARVVAPVDFLGIAATNEGSEVTPRSGASFDKAYTLKLARAHEGHGWDRVLFAYGSGSPDPSPAAAYIAARTETRGQADKPDLPGTLPARPAFEDRGPGQSPGSGKGLVRDKPAAGAPPRSPHPTEL